MVNRKAFTLIELLVVIAIIALLLSILMPSLTAAKKQVTGIVCSSNNRALAQAWHLYQDDNEGWLCGGNTYNRQQWLGPPVDASGTEITTNIPVDYEDEVRGYENGTLWPYLETPKIYHCPGDKQWQLLDRGYRSTSIQGMMNGESSSTTPGYAQKVSNIISPGTKYVFIENVDPRGWNMGSWIMGSPDSTSPNLIDPIAVFHGDWSTFGFADGHADKRRWQSQRLVDWTKGATDGTAGFNFNYGIQDQHDKDDLTWLAKGYIPGAH